MTREGYTQIIVPKELHAILKAEAEAREVSIATYIAEVLGTLQSIGTLAPAKSCIDTTKKHSRASNLKNIDSPGRIRTPVTGSKGQYA
jgi:hypothetical protein